MKIRYVRSIRHSAHKYLQIGYDKVGEMEILSDSGEGAIECLMRFGKQLEERAAAISHQEEVIAAAVQFARKGNNVSSHA